MITSSSVRGKRHSFDSYHAVKMVPIQMQTWTIDARYWDPYEMVTSQEAPISGQLVKYGPWEFVKNGGTEMGSGRVDNSWRNTDKKGTRLST